MSVLGCKRCGYTWDYKGDAYYTSCPRCRTSVRTAKVIVKQVSK